MATLTPKPAATGSPAFIEDISALLIDAGTCWTRAGYSGDDSPVAYFSSMIGSINQQDQASAATQPSPTNPPDSAKNSRYVFSSSIYNWQPDLEIVSPFNRGDISDISLLEEIWRYAFKVRMRTKTSQSPILAIEPAITARETRRQITQMAFETFNTPGFFLIKSPTSACFASGRSTGLVIESGARNAFASAVYDGYVLSKSVFRSSLAGEALDEMVLNRYGPHGNHSDLHPLYQIKSKRPVVPGAPCDVTLRSFSQTHPSFHKNSQMLVARDLKESCLEVATVPYQKNEPSTKSYELPCGYGITLHDYTQLPEVLFAPENAPPSMLPDWLQPNSYSAPTMSPDAVIAQTGLVQSEKDSASHASSVISLAMSTLQSVDVELRSILLSNIVLTGGTTNMPGFYSRFTSEISAKFPGAKIRVHNQLTPTERKCAAWLGGSVLSSLSSFHSLWITKKDYDEVGRNIVDKKCL